MLPLLRGKFCLFSFPSVSFGGKRVGAWLILELATSVPLNLGSLLRCLSGLEGSSFSVWTLFNSSWCDPPKFTASFWCTSDGYLECWRSGSDSHLLQASQLRSDHPGVWFCKVPLQRNVLGRDAVWFEVSLTAHASISEIPLSSFCLTSFLCPWRNQKRDSSQLSPASPPSL